jgi:hypothetical protein
MKQPDREDQDYVTMFIQWCDEKGVPNTKRGSISWSIHHGRTNGKEHRCEADFKVSHANNIPVAHVELPKISSHPNRTQTTSEIRKELSTQTTLYTNDGRGTHTKM